MKKLVIFALAIMLVVSLTACGGAEQTVEPTPDDTVIEETPEAKNMEAVEKIQQAQTGALHLDAYELQGNEIEYGNTLDINEFESNIVDSSALPAGSTYSIKLNKLSDVADNPVEEISTGEDGNIDSYKFMSIEPIEFTVEIITPNATGDDVITSEIVKVAVVDTRPPVIEGMSDKTITEGDTIDLREGITAKDPVDGDIDFITEGDYAGVGEHEIMIVATDQHQNKAEAGFIVKVIKKPATKKDTKTYVFIAPTGKKYHYIESCRGLSRAKSTTKITEAEAIKRGYTKCAFE